MPYKGRIRTSAIVQERARELRHHSTPAEQVLWAALRGRQLAGLKFRRQHPLGPFIVDFCCPERRVIVEVDGPIHDDQGEADAARTAQLTAHGYQVLRFANAQVLEHLPEVLAAIQTACAQPAATGATDALL